MLLPGHGPTRARVTREEAERFWNIRSGAGPLNLLQDKRNYAKVSRNLLTDSSVVRHMKNTTGKSSKKTTKPAIAEAAAPAPASVAEDMPESKEEQNAVVTLRTEFLDVQAKHAVAPIAFRETQRDFKRYAAVIAATSSKTLRSAMAKPSRMRKTSALLCVGSCAGHPATSQPLRKPNTLNFNLKSIRARPKWRAFSC